MLGPAEDFRAYVSQRVESLVTEGVWAEAVSERAEDALDDILTEIAAVAESDLASDEFLTSSAAFEARNLTVEQAEDLLAAVNAWASVASYAAARLYAPNSPWRTGLAGWSKKIAKTLGRIVSILLTPLKAVAVALGASSWSIGINFPWAGVAVSLTWP
jgi:hypothetical protein